MDVMDLDAQNGNSLWMDAEGVELSQIDEYEVLKDLGFKGVAPMGHKRITVYFVYDVKYDGRHKARLVAGGHLTETPVESVYSSVVSLRGLCIALFLAELNRLET